MLRSRVGLGFGKKVKALGNRLIYQKYSTLCLKGWSLGEIDFGVPYKHIEIRHNCVEIHTIVSICILRASHCFLEIENL